MTDFQTLKNDFFLQSADSLVSGQPVPYTFSDSRITPIIDCAEFNKEIEKALDMVGGTNTDGHFILIANWCLALSGGEFKRAKLFGADLTLDESSTSQDRLLMYLLDGPKGLKPLRGRIIQKSKEGVDVRVLGWVSLGLMDVPGVRRLNAAESMTAINAFTLQSIVDLRAEPTLEKRAVLNTIAHSRGAVHTKMAIFGTNAGAVGFTGGLDFRNDRWANLYHSDGTWHDVVAKVEGPAVEGLYEFFRDMWNEATRDDFIRKIRFEGKDVPSHFKGTEKILAPTFDKTTKKGKHHVQSLRTVPQHNYALSLLPRPPHPQFAPHGKIEFRNALKKAIGAARRYIYMEDQSFFSREVMEWVHDSLKATPALKVILLTSGGADPTDPKFSDAILCSSINEGLLDHDNQSELPTRLSQVRMFRRINDAKLVKWVKVSDVTGNGAKSRVVTSFILPGPVAKDGIGRFELRAVNERFIVIGNDAGLAGTPLVVFVKNASGTDVPGASPLYELAYIPGIVVHSKTTIIDDQWAVIGSANIMRRSLYTDYEHCVAFLDEDGTLVRQYRMNLWSDHFEHPPKDFADIDHGLFAWEQSWGTKGPIKKRPSDLESITLPLKHTAFNPVTRMKYNRTQDPDSRRTW